VAVTKDGSRLWTNADVGWTAGGEFSMVIDSADNIVTRGRARMNFPYPNYKMDGVDWPDNELAVTEIGGEKYSKLKAWPSYLFGFDKLGNHMWTKFVEEETQPEAYQCPASSSVDYYGHCAIQTSWIGKLAFKCTG